MLKKNNMDHLIYCLSYMWHDHDSTNNMDVDTCKFGLYFLKYDIKLKIINNPTFYD